MLLIVLKIWGKDSGHKRKATSDSTSHGRPRRGVRGAPSGVAHAVVVQPLFVCASPAIARHRPASNFSPTSSYSMRGGPAAAGRWVVISCRQRSGGLETGRNPSPLCPPPSPAVPPPEPPRAAVLSPPRAGDALPVALSCSVLPLWSLAPSAITWPAGRHCTPHCTPCLPSSALSLCLETVTCSEYPIYLDFPLHWKLAFSFLFFMYFFFYRGNIGH